MGSPSIHGEITLDGSLFKRGLQGASNSAASFLKSFALGAVGIYGVQAALQKTIESADELVNTANKLDTSVEQLQILRQAAKESGVEFGTLASAMEKYNVAREKALSGGKDSAALLASFQRLGINREQLESQTAATSIMGQISQTARSSNAADIAKELRDIFGRGGDELFGALKTDFNELGQRMKSVGAIMDDTTAHELKKFKDEMSLIGEIISSTVAPYLVKFGGYLYDAMTALGAFGTAAGTYFTDLIHGHFKAAGDDAAEAAKQFVEDRNAAWEEMVKNAQPKTPQPPAIVPETEKPEKAQQETNAKEEHTKALREHSDSLIESGNFLGAGRGAIDSLNEQQLQVAKEHLNVAKDTRQLMEKFINGKSVLTSDDQEGWPL